MVGQPSKQNRDYRFPNLDGEVLDELRREGKIRDGCEERVMAYFRDSVVCLCGERIGNYLLTVSGQRDISGAELGRVTGKARNTVHTWFKSGIRSFDGLILSISELDIDWGTLPCPSRLERTIYGYVEATTYVRQNELAEGQCSKLNPEQWEYLLEQNSSLRWRFAVAGGDWEEIKALAVEFERNIMRRTGQQPSIRGAQMVKGIWEEWNEAFQVCIYAIPVRWLEHDEANTQIAD